MTITCASRVSPRANVNRSELGGAPRWKSIHGRRSLPRTSSECLLDSRRLQTVSSNHTSVRTRRSERVSRLIRSGSVQETTRDKKLHSRIVHEYHRTLQHDGVASQHRQISVLARVPVPVMGASTSSKLGSSRSTLLASVKMNNACATRVYPSAMRQVSIEVEGVSANRSHRIARTQRGLGKTKVGGG